MKICLKTIAKEDASQHVTLTMHERLPFSVEAPVVLSCDYRVENCKNYYLLTMNVNGVLAITCQRCLTHFEHNFSHQTSLAVCQDDVYAERLMEQFECIVAMDHQVNLLEIVADDMHLYAPEKHANLADCDREMCQWIAGQDEILPSTLGL